MRPARAVTVRCRRGGSRLLLCRRRTAGRRPDWQEAYLIRSRGAQLLLAPIETADGYSAVFDIGLQTD